MDNIKAETIELLRQQMKLLAEQSKSEKNDAETLIRISAEMDRLAVTILNACGC